MIEHMSFLNPSLAQHLSKIHNRQNIITICSGRGSIGKTWVSIMLAEAFAAQGQKVLLFDGELGGNNINNYLPIANHQEISNVLIGKTPMNRIISHYGAGNFDVICGYSNNGSLSHADDAMRQLIRDDLLLLSTHYDKVIIDAGSNIRKQAKIWVEVADIILALCVDEQDSLADICQLAKDLLENQCFEKLRVVINMAVSQKHGQRTNDTLVGACQNYLGLKPLLGGIIRQDMCVNMAMKKQSSIRFIFPACKALEDIDRLVGEIIN